MNKQFEEWFSGTVYTDIDCARDAWEARVPKGYVVVPEELVERDMVIGCFVAKQGTEEANFLYNEWYGEGVLDDIPEATHAVVPIEPTEAMLDRGLAYCRTRHSLDQAWAAMIEAAQEEEW